MYNYYIYTELIPRATPRQSTPMLWGEGEGEKPTTDVFIGRF